MADHHEYAKKSEKSNCTILVKFMNNLSSHLLIYIKRMMCNNHYFCKLLYVLFIHKEKASGLKANWFLDPIGFNYIYMRKYEVFNFFICMLVFM